MKSIFLLLIISFLTSCSATHNHYHYPDHKKNKNHVKKHRYNEFMNHSYMDYGSHIVVIVKHKHKLSKNERQKMKKWCRNHYKHHNKQIKFKFILN